MPIGSLTYQYAPSPVSASAVRRNLTGCDWVECVSQGVGSSGYEFQKQKMIYAFQSADALAVGYKIYTTCNILGTKDLYDGYTLDSHPRMYRDPNGMISNTSWHNEHLPCLGKKLRELEQEARERQHRIAKQRDIRTYFLLKKKI